MLEWWDDQDYRHSFGHFSISSNHWDNSPFLYTLWFFGLVSFHVISFFHFVFPKSWSDILGFEVKYWWNHMYIKMDGFNIDPLMIEEIWKHHSNPEIPGILVVFSHPLYHSWLLCYIPLFPLYILQSSISQCIWEIHRYSLVILF